MRSAAQLISYEVAMGLSLLGVVMMAGSLSLVDIVKAQGEMWYVVPQFVGFLIFLVGGFAFNEYFAPGSSTLPILPFVVGSVLGAVIVGLLKEWALIVVACLIGTYLIYGVLPIFGTARILASGAIFVIGALAQVTMYQMQKHSDR